MGKLAEKAKRKGVLDLLYTKRCNEPEKPTLNLHELEDLLGCPREHLEFSLWYLKENGLVVRMDNGRFAVTAKEKMVTCKFGADDQKLLGAARAWFLVSGASQGIGRAVALELAQGRYSLGLASIVEITQAELNLTQAQIENVSARYDYQSAYAELQYTIGALR